MDKALLRGRLLRQTEPLDPVSGLPDIDVRDAGWRKS